MSDGTRRRGLPGMPGLIAGALTILGVLLFMFVHKGLLVVAGLGIFGPGILRELGWLNDHDEFQRQAAHRAGYHAYLVGGFAALVIFAALESLGDRLEVTSEWVLLILVVLWLAWMFSSLMAYWGARRTASTVLLVFGSFWAVFAIATIISEATGASAGDALIGVLATVGIVGPFFLLAWTAHRWPRVTGLLLLLVSAVFLLMFKPGAGTQRWSTTLLTDALLIVPLAASGIALLREGGNRSERRVDAAG
jgi:hypothetical protein